MTGLRPPFVAIGMLSACLLSYEVLLTRLFSIVLWHHFAYMIISAAMLGYGASGTVLTLLKDKITPYFCHAYIMAAMGAAFLMPLSFLIAQQVPFNPLEILWDGSQLVKLLAIYLLMMLPFFCGGFSIGLIFSYYGRKAGHIYAADILGAGVGSIGVIGLLFLVPPSKALITLTVLALLATAVAIVELKLRTKWLIKILLSFTFIVAVFLPDSWLQIRSSIYKDLNQTLNITGSQVIEERSSPLGEISVVQNNSVPFRYAPGMSLNATDEPPIQLGVFIDGDGPSVLTQFTGELETLAYLDQLTSALPYHILDQPSVLVLGSGAGSDVLQALYHDAVLVDAVELNHNIVDLVQQQFRDFSGDLYNRQEVHIYKSEARGFVNTIDSHNYDLIQVALLDSFGATSAGLYSLSESYLYTVEALQTYLRRLNPHGMLAITRWLTLPPRDSLKLFATVVSVLEGKGIFNPSARLVMIRGWKTVTLLVKNSDFTAKEIIAIKEFSHTHSFDMSYYPGMVAGEANKYNLLEHPYYYDGAVALLSSKQQTFLDQYKFNIEPATDDQPYFFNFFKWDAAGELFALREQGGVPLLDWSYPLLVTTLVQAFVASILLILAPLGVSRFRHKLPTIQVALYFLFIGLAFMFLEIAFIQKFILFLSHPLYAVAVVLCAFLVFAAIGSWLSERWQDKVTSRWHVPLAVVLIGVLSLLYLGILPSLFQALIHFSDLIKIVISLALIAPLALCLGVPFPTGVKRLAYTAHEAIPWAWAVNGCASVIGAVLATLLAIHLGFSIVIFIAVLFYSLACIFLRTLG
jgi:spermidine synthase